MNDLATLIEQHIGNPWIGGRPARTADEIRAGVPERYAYRLTEADCRLIVRRLRPWWKRLRTRNWSDNIPQKIAEWINEQKEIAMGGWWDQEYDRQQYEDAERENAERNQLEALKKKYETSTPAQ